MLNYQRVSLHSNAGFIRPGLTFHKKIRCGEAHNDGYTFHKDLRVSHGRRFHPRGFQQQTLGETGAEWIR